MKRELNLNFWGQGRKAHTNKLLAEAMTAYGVSPEQQRRALLEIEMISRRASYDFIRTHTPALFAEIYRLTRNGAGIEGLTERANTLARHRLEQTTEYIRLAFALSEVI